MAALRKTLLKMAGLVCCAVVPACGADPGTSAENSPQIAQTGSAEKFVLDDKAAEQLHLVDRLQVNDSLVVEFYEPTAGTMMISEYGRAGGETLRSLLPGVNVSELRPSDYYALLAPSKKMPTALVELEARLGSQTTTRTITDSHVAARTETPTPVTPVTETPAGSAIIEKATHLCDAVWFQDRFCGSDDWTFCDLNKHVNTTHSKGNIAFFNSALCSDIGSVQWTVSGAGLSGSWTVLAGYYRTYGITCGSSFFDFCDEFTGTWKVTDAQSSDWYHQWAGVTLDN